MSLTTAAGHNDLAETVQILSPDGDLVAPLPNGLGDAELEQMYRWMVRLRAFDSRALTLQRQGRLGTYPPFSGQEACQAGSVLPLDKTDWICPTYRDHGAMIVHGDPMVKVLRYWKGDEWGSHLPGVCTLPQSVPIATQCLHAVGLAWAGKLQGKSTVGVSYLGDGATSEGDFHEAMNFAGVFKLPTIFFCQNNYYAISVPLSQQTAAPIVNKAAGYGVHGVRVDGNDILAVWSVMSQAVSRGRAGQGATLIEALTYRYGPHTTADDPSRYRTADEVRTWQEGRDPIVRLYRFLTKNGLWDDVAEQQLQEDAREEVAVAVSQAEEAGATRPEDIFAHVYAKQPWYLKEQEANMLSHRRTSGEGEQHG